MTPSTQASDEALSETECWSLLGSTQTGRFTSSIDEYPSIIPVQLLVDGQSIAVCLGPHDLDTRYTEGAMVRILADSFVDGSTSGWTVQVHGMARIPDSTEPWRDCGQSAAGKVLHIDNPVVSGRRLTLCPFISSLDCLLAMGR